MFSHLVHMWTKNVHISWTDLFMSKKKNYCQKIKKKPINIWIYTLFCTFVQMKFRLFVMQGSWDKYDHYQTSSRVLWSDICDGLDRTIPCGPYPVRLCHWFGLSYTRFCQTGATAGVCILHRVHDRCTLRC